VCVCLSVWTECEVMHGGYVREEERAGVRERERERARAQASERASERARERPHCVCVDMGIYCVCVGMCIV
jgi:hypothetical protein